MGDVGGICGSCCFGVGIVWPGRGVGRAWECGKCYGLLHSNFYVCFSLHSHCGDVWVYTLVWLDVDACFLMFSYPLGGGDCGRVNMERALNIFHLMSISFCTFWTSVFWDQDDLAAGEG